MFLAVNAPSPIATRASVDAFADAFVARVEAAAAGAPLEGDAGTIAPGGGGNVPLALAVGALLGLGAHPVAVFDFFGGVARASAAGADLGAPFGFWAFFAAMHPLIGGAGVGLGEATWGMPGYIAAGLDPALVGTPAGASFSAAARDAAGPPLAFTALSLAVSAGLQAVPALKNGAAALASGLFFLSISSGLAGVSGDNGSLNLGLDDAPVAGVQIAGDVRGCPAYADVKRPSMEGFDVRKYQGKWYEHAYHDWTQFAEVYDTSLDIVLAEDGLTWVDDFAVKGPSPTAAPRSWRGSPVANGAHYPLYGTLDPSKPGEMQEKGFGNVFPNYIVDVTKNAAGEYTEAIQFQCLDAGGVRVFEGINFMSRDRTIDAPTLARFFDRAEAAGLAPYGARPDQMHVVEHLPSEPPPVDNWWQRAWTAVGVDKLLALVAADI